MPVTTKLAMSMKAVVTSRRSVSFINGNASHTAETLKSTLVVPFLTTT